MRHREVERGFDVCWWDRETLRPAFAIRRLSVTYTHDPLTVELGKQLIRWGKADLLNPTGVFAPRDYLDVVETEYLGIEYSQAFGQHRRATTAATWIHGSVNDCLGQYRRNSNFSFILRYSF